MSERLKIEYYNDLLCVWAWIAERRNAELSEEWGSQVCLEPHYLDLFSDTAKRIGQGWMNRGGFQAFGDHVRKAAEPYLEEPVHHDVWKVVRPTTSANAHLVLHAARLTNGAEAAHQLAHEFRRAFFADAVDISQLDVLYELAEAHKVETDNIRAALKSGRAMAGLLGDLRAANEARIAGSPTWIMNGGRQILYGNVGYRVLSANVEELLRRPEHEASWC